MEALNEYWNTAFESITFQNFITLKNAIKLEWENLEYHVIKNTLAVSVKLCRLTCYTHGSQIEHLLQNMFKDKRMSGPLLRFKINGMNCRWVAQSEYESAYNSTWILFWRWGKYSTCIGQLYFVIEFLIFYVYAQLLKSPLKKIVLFENEHSSILLIHWKFSVTHDSHKSVLGQKWKSDEPFTPLINFLQISQRAEPLPR